MIWLKLISLNYGTSCQLSKIKITTLLLSYVLISLHTLERCLKWKVYHLQNTETNQIKPSSNGYLRSKLILKSSNVCGCFTSWGTDISYIRLFHFNDGCDVGQYCPRDYSGLLLWGHLFCTRKWPFKRGGLSRGVASRQG